MNGTAWLALAAGSLGLPALLVAEGRNLPRLRAVAKLTCSAGFLLLAASLGVEGAYARVLLLGLALCAAGDALLLFPGERAFLAGLVAFLLGHLAYAVAFAGLSAPTPWIAALLVAAAALTLRWLWPHLGPMRAPVTVYCAVISVMLWLALGTPRLELRLGAVLFYLSDLLLARDRFVRAGLRNQLLLLPLYFTAQYLIALTLR
jgi:uncharacterized membrane protein YhhN